MHIDASLDCITIIMTRLKNSLILFPCSARFCCFQWTYPNVRGVLAALKISDAEIFEIFMLGLRQANNASNK